MLNMSGVIRFIFFFNDTATTEIYTLSLHDALPILICLPRASVTVTCAPPAGAGAAGVPAGASVVPHAASTSAATAADRKSTRLNSSHANISYAVFCLKKKNTNQTDRRYSRRRDGLR